MSYPLPFDFTKFLKLSKKEEENPTIVLKHILLRISQNDIMLITSFAVLLAVFQMSNAIPQIVDISTSSTTDTSTSSTTDSFTSSTTDTPTPLASNVVLLAAEYDLPYITPYGAMTTGDKTTYSLSGTIPATTILGSSLPAAPFSEIRITVDPSSYAFDQTTTSSDLTMTNQVHCSRSSMELLGCRVTLQAPGASKYTDIISSLESVANGVYATTTGETLVEKTAVPSSTSGSSSLSGARAPFLLGLCLLGIFIVN
jgi:hypothetical protein